MIQWLNKNILYCYIVLISLRYHFLVIKKRFFTGFFFSQYILDIFHMFIIIEKINNELCFRLFDMLEPMLHQPSIFSEQLGQLFGWLDSWN